MALVAHPWRHLGLLVTVWERASRPFCVCMCVAMCRGLWGFELYCVKEYGPFRNQWKGSAWPDVIQSSILLPPVAKSCSTCHYRPASLISGWEKPLQSHWNGALLKGVNRVDILLMYPCYYLGMAVPAWSRVACVLMNTRLKIHASLGGGVCLCIWVTPGRTLNISEVGNCWPIWCYPNDVGSHLLGSTSYRLDFDQNSELPFWASGLLSVFPLLIQCAISMTYLQHLQGMQREHIQHMRLLSRPVSTGCEVPCQLEKDCTCPWADKNQSRG